MQSRFASFLAIFLVCCAAVCGKTSFAAQSPVRDRILRAAERRSTFVIGGHIHPFARPANDRGKVSDSFVMERVSMMFKSDDAQQAGLDAFLEERQDPASPNYHKWLSPEEFGDRFGLSANDVTQVVSWLRGQGFVVDHIADSRRWVTFSGSASQIESSFQTEIHQYVVNNETFYANASEPAIPGAFAGVVSGFRALNNFRLKPRPRFTSNVTGNHFLSPADFATIYDLNGLYASGLDGRGQKVAVMGQTDIQLSDIRTFRSISGLPANDPQIVLVPGSSDPGTNNGDLGEADLDLEWAGTVARNAQLIYVNSKNGAFDSLQYAIDQNLAPVISISYGGCEKNFTAQEINILAALGQQANAQGITILAASGDTGAADCEASSTKSTLAREGLAVDIPASLPSVTGLGGSEFRESAAAWSTANDAVNGSALSYIPETAWNDTSTGGQFAAGGGGHSIYFAKPLWQTGMGVPGDNARDVPDVSMNASASHDGYLVCSLGSCTNGFRSGNGGLTVVGGTSAGAPVFAGIVALINQQASSPQGNINPILYRLAVSAPLAFHDITTGGNQVQCQAGTADCASGGYIGYSAGPGYDQATGLGSVDAANLIASWPLPSASGSTASSPLPAQTPVGVTLSSDVPVSVPQPITDVEQGTIRSGYAIITPDTNSGAASPTVTFGMVSGGAVQSQAGILPIPSMTDASLLVEVIPDIGRNLGIAIANPAAAVNAVTLTLRDQTGVIAGTPVSISLQPHQQLAKYISEVFSDVIGTGFRGSLRLQSSTPFAVLGLRFSGIQVSTLPVTDTAASGLNSGAILIPQFAMSGGWATQIGLVNNNGALSSGRIDVFDTNGNPMQVRLNGSTQSTFTYSIPAGGTFLLAPRDANGQSPF